MSNELANALNLNTLTPTEVQTQEVASVSNNLPEDVKQKVEEANVDFITARKNIHEAVELGQKTLKDLAEVARTAQSGRIYEVFTELLQAIVDTNEKLVNIHVTRKELDNFVDASSVSKEQKIETQNNLFVGSTAELQEVIKKVKDAKQE